MLVAVEFRPISMQLTLNFRRPWKFNGAIELDSSQLIRVKSSMRMISEVTDSVSRKVLQLATHWNHPFCAITGG